MNTSSIETLALAQSPTTVREALAVLPALLKVDTYETRSADELGFGTMTVRAADVVCRFDLMGEGAIPKLAEVTRDGAMVLEGSGASFLADLLCAGREAHSDRYWTLGPNEVAANVAKFNALVERIAASVAD